MKKFIIAVITCTLIASGVYLPGYHVHGAETNEKEIPVILYHHIDNDKKAKGSIITTEQFKRDMLYLSENNFTTLLPQDILDIKSGKIKMPERPVMINFDDGYESNYRIAYPILKELGLKATIFVIAKSMDKKVHGQFPKLTWDQMKEMYDSGLVEIQSHSYNLHNPDFNGGYFRYGVNGIYRGFIETQASYELRLEKDIKLSKELIESNVGNTVNAFAYPYGVYDEWCLTPLKNQKIDMAFVLGNDTANIKNDLFALERISITTDVNLREILENIFNIEEIDKMA